MTGHDTYSAVDAAYMLHRSPKTLYRALAAGRIRATEKRDGVWRLTLDQVARLGRIDPARREECALRSRDALATLSARVRLLEERERIFGPAPVPVLHKSTQDVGAAFASRTAAAHWLAEHGANFHTARAWPGWERVALTPEGVLGFGLSHVDPTNYRSHTRLVACARASCVCRGMLA